MLFLGRIIMTCDAIYKITLVRDCDRRLGGFHASSRVASNATITGPSQVLSHTRGKATIRGFADFRVGNYPWQPPANMGWKVAADTFFDRIHASV